MASEDLAFWASLTDSDWDSDDLEVLEDSASLEDMDLADLTVVYTAYITRSKRNLH